MPDRTPSQPEFPVVRRGYEPQAVADHILALTRAMEDKVAAAQARYGNLESDLAQAHQREEAVHLTLVAATKTKEELLVNAQRDADETLSKSKEQADGLLAEAKKEAFRLVADARQTAEEASSMAREEVQQITQEANASAEATRDAARREAVEMINTVETDTSSLMKAHETSMAEMRKRFEDEEAELTARIEVLRATAADLDSRLRAIATGSLNHAADLAAQAAQSPVTPPNAAVEPIPSYTSAAVETAPVAETAVTTVADTAMPEAEIEATTIADVAHVVEAAPASDPAPLNGVDPSPARKARPSIRPELLEGALLESGSETHGEPVRDTASEAVTEPTESSEAVATQSIDDEVAPQRDAAESVSDDHHDDEVAAPHVDDEPEPIPAGVGARPTSDSESASNRKGSYYSRRSAKLPRIGNEAGRNALAVANAVRGASRGGPRSDSEDVAVKTA